MPLFSFTNIPWTPVITTLIQHQSCLHSSRPANHQVILMYWDAKKQQDTDSSCLTIVPLQNTLSVHIFKVEHAVPALNRILIWLNTHIISRNGVYQINKQPLKMTALAPCKPLLVCGTGMYFGSFAHPLYWELKHLFNRCDSRANSTHVAGAHFCNLNFENTYNSSILFYTCTRSTGAPVES